MEIYVGLIIIAIIYLSYLLVIVCSKKHLTKYMKKSREVNIIRNKYKIDFDKINSKLVANMFGLCNGLVLGSTYIVMSLVNNFIIKLILAFILLIILILIEYAFLGKFFKRKEEK